MVTDAQYERLLGRVTKLETTMNDMLVAMSNMVSLGQVNALLVVLQTDLTDITETVDALEDRVAVIESEPIN